MAASRAGPTKKEFDRFGCQRDPDWPVDFGVSPGWRNRPLHMLLEMIKSPYYLPIRPQIRALIKERAGDPTDYRPTAGYINHDREIRLNGQKHGRRP